MDAPDPRPAFIRVVRRQDGAMYAIDVDADRDWNEVAYLVPGTGVFGQPPYGLNHAPELYRPGLGLLARAHNASAARGAPSARVPTPGPERRARRPARP